MAYQTTAPKVVELRLIGGTGPVRAFADVKIGDWIVHDWRVLKKSGEPAWVQCPQVSWRDKEGRVKYRTLFTIPAELKKRIEVVILSRWEQELSNEHLS